MLADFCHEPVPLSGYRFDVACVLGIVAERLAQQRDDPGQGIIGYGSILPHRLKKFVLGYDPLAIFNKIDQNSDRLRFQWQQLPRFFDPEELRRYSQIVKAVYGHGSAPANIMHNKRCTGMLLSNRGVASTHGPAEGPSSLSPPLRQPISAGISNRKPTSV